MWIVLNYANLSPRPPKQLLGERGERPSKGRKKLCFLSLGACAMQDVGSHCPWGD